jgi:hypothetical protein
VILFLKFGFAKTVYKIGKAWLSVICSMVLGPWVAEQLQKLFLRRMITNAVHSTLSNLVNNNANEYNLGELFQNLPEGFVKFLGNYQVDPAALEAEFGSLTYASDEIMRTISGRLAAPCVSVVSGIIGHIVCFIVPLVFFVWLNMKIRSCRKPFFRYVDRVSGFVVGICVGYCAVVCVSLLLQSTFQVVLAFDMNSGVTDVYRKSLIFEFMTKFDTFTMIRNMIGK